MSKVIKKDKIYLVQSTYGSYPFNNLKTAEQLNNTLNNYEKISQQFKQTEQKLDKAQKGIINLQITLKIMEHEINKLKEEIQ